MLAPFFGFGRLKKGTLSFDPAISTPKAYIALLLAEN